VQNPIEEVRGVLSAWGWIQGPFESEDGFCLVGALEATFGVTLRNPDDFILLPLLLPEDRLTRLATVVRLLCRETDAEPGDQGLDHWGLAHLWMFNDDSATTYEDIVLVLKRASAALEDEAELRRVGHNSTASTKVELS
jgi:hypothetical protein